MDMETRKAVEVFAAKISDQFDVSRLVLFGSRARGDNRADSDADVAVFLKGEDGDFVEAKLAMSGIAFGVLVETGIRVQPLPVWEGEWERPGQYSNPDMLKNIAKDGVRIRIPSRRGRRPQYQLSELLAECDEMAPYPDDLAEWDEAPPVGREFL